MTPPVLAGAPAAAAARLSRFAAAGPRRRPARPLSWASPVLRGSFLSTSKLGGFVLTQALALLVMAPAPAQAARPVPLVPLHGHLLGGYFAHARGVSHQEQVLAVERGLGHKIAIDHEYLRWGSRWPNRQQLWDEASGRIPFVNWRGVRSRGITRGRYDRMIEARAQAVAALDHPIMISYYAEMDRYSRRERGTARGFRRAWRHIWNIFQRAGANRNAVWVWCATGYGLTRQSGRPVRAAAFWPGSAYVDWACYDGYNWGGSRWRGLYRTLHGPYAWLRRHHPAKPIVVAEFASVEGSPGAKAHWIRSAARVVSDRLPHIMALCYFDARPTDHTSRYDWRLTTSRSAYRAFAALGRASAFHAGY